MTERCWVFYEEDNLRKIIEVTQGKENNTSYYERDLCVKTIENHTLAIGKKNQKTYKITPSYIRSLYGDGVYVFCSNRFICIGNFTSQKSFYTSLDEKITSLEDMNNWVRNWVSKTTDEDLEKFKTESRIHQKSRNGIFFASKLVAGYMDTTPHSFKYCNFAKKERIIRRITRISFTRNIFIN